MLWYQNNAPRIWRCAQSDFIAMSRLTLLITTPTPPSALSAGRCAAIRSRSTWSISPRTQELSCAKTIAIQLGCIVNQFRFHRRRMQMIAEQTLTPPCDLPADDRLIAIMREEISVAKQALPLVEADSRIGWHQEYQGYHYDAAMIRQKINAMEIEVQFHENVYHKALTVVYAPVGRRQFVNKHSGSDP